VTYWPLGKQGESVIVVVGDEAADRVAGLLPGELDQIGVVPVGIPDLDVDPEQLILDVLSAPAVRDVELLLPAGPESQEFGEAVSEALVDSTGHPAMVDLLPEDWEVADLVELSRRSEGTFGILLRALWLAAGPPQAQLVDHLRTMADPADGETAGGFLRASLAAEYATGSGELMGPG